MKTVYVVSSTHWDREWYETFQNYRSRLVRMVDNLLDIMENDNEYKFFHFDGQTILINDYLEIRPKNKERFAKLIQEGRILVGPWYTMPDEFLISGEALVRNLQKGQAICSEYGVKPNKNGYVCDIFGHNDQMPQIFKGFGIDAVTLFRGREGYEKDNFLWKGADDTEVIVHKLHPDYAYSQFYFVARWQAYGKKKNSNEDIVRKVRKYLTEEEFNMATNSVLMIDGVDHIDAEKNIPEILKMLNEQIEGYHFVHSNFEDYTAEVRKKIDSLERVEGCFYDVGKEGTNNNVLKNVLSSQVHLKQMNDYLESHLTLDTEVMNSFLSFSINKFNNYIGKYPYDGFLNVAWDNLLKNQPHDSICGCSISEVHEEMITRYNSANQIVALVNNDITRYFAENISVSGVGKDGGIVVFNNSQLDIDEIREIQFEVLNGTHQNNFHIYDKDGADLPFAVTNISSYYRHDSDYGKLIEFPKFDVFTVALPVKVKAFSYTVLTLELLNNTRTCEDNNWKFDEVKGFNRNTTSMRKAIDTIDNSKLKVTFNSNGTLDIFVKESNKSFKNMMIFEDCGDCGDGWNYISPMLNSEINSLASTASIEVLCDTKQCFKAKVLLEMILPKQANYLKRDDKYKKLLLENYITIYDKSSQINIKTVVKNNVNNHRLRVMFPTFIKSEIFTTLLPFNMYDWNINKKDCSKTKETDTLVNPNQGAVLLRDKDCSFTLYNKGLYEVSVLPREDAPVYLTLMRSFDNEVGKAANSGIMGRMLDRELIAEYAIDFTNHTKSIALKKANNFKIGIHSFMSSYGKKVLQDNYTFAKITGNAVLSSMREGQIIEGKELCTLRIYDVDGASAGEIIFGREIEVVYEVNLGEDKIISELVTQNNGFKYTLNKKQIKTYAIKLR